MRTGRRLPQARRRPRRGSPCAFARVLSGYAPHQAAGGSCIHVLSGSSPGPPGRELAPGGPAANRLLCRATYSGDTPRHKMTPGLSLLWAVTIRQRGAPGPRVGIEATHGEVNLPRRLALSLTEC